MRLATFNVENLFDRASALRGSVEEESPLLGEFAELNDLLRRRTYSDGSKARIRDLLVALGMEASDDGTGHVRLRQNRGRLVRRPQAGGLEIVAGGRADWVGWVELKTEPVDELATQHTAMVLRDVAADVVGVVEADNRVALKRFNDQMLPFVGAVPYRHVMVIDGNDDRGIDVGVLARAGHRIVRVVSHVDDLDADGVVFSRDCPEYTIATPAGNTVVVLVNHLKSKGYGTDTDRRRRRQAHRIQTIYEGLLMGGQPNVAVVGDLNDTPGSWPLEPLFEAGLRDIAEHPAFAGDGRPGTYANGTKGGKIDYVLLSPALYARVTGGSVFRMGVWGGVNGTLFPHYETMTKAVHAASDHAALYADLDI